MPLAAAPPAAAGSQVVEKPSALRLDVADKVTATAQIDVFESALSPNAAGTRAAVEAPATALPTIASAEAAKSPAEAGELASVFNPVEGSGPVAPLGTAVSWALVAASRREIGGVITRVSAPASAAGPAGPLLDPTAATPESAAVQDAVAGLSTVPHALREASAAATVTPKDSIDITFSGFNSSVGWIPVVGTVINAVKFAIDAVGLVGSAIALDFPQVITELGNLVVDTIGLVPVVGGPIAALLYQTVLGGNVKLGSLVQQSLQSSLDVDSTWAQYQFYVEAVDVSIGLGGSQGGTATVSKPNHSGVGVIVDVINNGFEYGWSVPLEGRLQLLSLAYS